MLKSSFKNDHPFEKRQLESRRIREKFPNRIPIVLERAQGSKIGDIEKKKFLAPDDLPLSYFHNIIRQKISLSPEMGLFIFVNNILPRVE